MRKTVTLLERAKVDAMLVRMSIDQATEDDLFLDAAAYHLQQSIEKAIKYTFEINGCQYPLVHNIYELWEFSEANNIPLPQWVYDNADTLNSYATRTRYGKNVIGTKRKIEELLKIVTEYIEALAPEHTNTPLTPASVFSSKPKGGHQI